MNYTKQLIVKDWFASKKASESKRRFYTNDVFAILAKSEKAVKVLCISDFCGIFTYWAPKSCLDIAVTNHDGLYEELNASKEEVNELVDSMNVTTYEEAIANYNDMMSLYR